MSDEVHATLPDDRPYQYQSLLKDTYIRLLELHPALPGSHNRLSGKVFTCPVSTVETYVAISYCWGSDKLDQQISTPDGLLYITTSLFDAITRYMDLADRPLIWADAVCIDQSNKKEKASQINLMPQIYRNAKFVAAFLGPTDDDSSHIYRLISNLAHRFFGPTLQQPKTVDELGQCGILPYADEAWVAAQNFFSRPWFRRVWIVQECVVAGDIRLYWGEKKMLAFEVVAGLMILISKLGVPILEFCREGTDDAAGGIMLRGIGCFNNLLRLRRRALCGESNSLLNLLQGCRKTESTCRRDKYFALLGLSNASQESLLQADYEDAFVNLAFRYAKFLMESDRDIGLLSLAQPRPTDSDLPSWIPDWTKDTLAHHLYDPTESNRHSRYQCATSRPAIWDVNENSHTLTIHGAVIDSVISTGQDHWNRKYKFSQSIVLNIWLDLCRLGLPYDSYPTAEPIGDVLWRTITMDSFPIDELYRAPPTGHQENLETFKASLLSARTLLEECPLAVPAAVWNSAECAMIQIAEILRGWKAVRSAKNYIGLLPIVAQNNDVIVAFLGAKVPYLLRPVPNVTPQKFQLLGECYVHGVMLGEVFTSSDPSLTDILLA